MIPLILTMGCIFFLCIGVGLATWAAVDMQEDGPHIKNIIIFFVGVGIGAFGIVSMSKASEYYHKKENSKTEITTSVPAQIDTIITIRNNISDTSYIYKFNTEE